MAHFGLGSNSGNVTVKVTWPSNLMVTYVNVTPNTRLRVVQPNRSVSNDYDGIEVTAYYKWRYIFICFLNDMCFIILFLTRKLTAAR